MNQVADIPLSHGKSFVFSLDTVLLFDMDGTAMQLLHDPKMRRLDARFERGLRVLHHFFPNQAIAITGRDYNQVKDCMNGQAPFFPCITSNGADLYMPDGNHYTYPFSPDEEAFITYMKEQVEAFSKEHPHLVVESKERSVGFHSSAVHGFGGGNVPQDVLGNMVTDSSQKALDLLEKLLAEAEDKKLSFKIAGAEATNRELHHKDVDKAPSVGWFSQYLTSLPAGEDWSNVLFCGDSLRGHGNDRGVAIEVKRRGGTVCIVTNESPNRMPRHSSPAAPHIGVASPEELGYMLLHAANAAVVERFGLNALKAFMKQSRELRYG